MRQRAVPGTVPAALGITTSSLVSLSLPPWVMVSTVVLCLAALAASLLVSIRIFEAKEL